jgi:hypothetical protein
MHSDQITIVGFHRFTNQKRRSFVDSRYFDWYFSKGVQKDLIEAL